MRRINLFFTVSLTLMWAGAPLYANEVLEPLGSETIAVDGGIESGGDEFAGSLSVSDPLPLPDSNPVDPSMEVQPGSLAADIKSVEQELQDIAEKSAETYERQLERKAKKQAKSKVHSSPKRAPASVGKAVAKSTAKVKSVKADKKVTKKIAGKKHDAKRDKKLAKKSSKNSKDKKTKIARRVASSRD